MCAGDQQPAAQYSPFRHSLHSNSSSLPAPIPAIRSEDYLCSCPPAAAHCKLGGTTGSCCLLADRAMCSCCHSQAEGTGRAVSGELDPGWQQWELHTLPLPAPWLGWHRVGQSSPSSQQSCRNKARGRRSPVSSPASGQSTEKSRVAEAAVAKPSYHCGAHSHWFLWSRQIGTTSALGGDAANSFSGDISPLLFRDLH